MVGVVIVSLFLCWCILFWVLNFGKLLLKCMEVLVIIFRFLLIIKVFSCCVFELNFRKRGVVILYLENF